MVVEVKHHIWASLTMHIIIVWFSESTTGLVQKLGRVVSRTALVVPRTISESPFLKGLTDLTSTPP